MHLVVQVQLDHKGQLVHKVSQVQLRKQVVLVQQEVQVQLAILDLPVVQVQQVVQAQPDKQVQPDHKVFREYLRGKAVVVLLVVPAQPALWDHKVRKAPKVQLVLLVQPVHKVLPVHKVFQDLLHNSVVLVLLALLALQEVLVVLAQQVLGFQEHRVLQADLAELEQQVQLDKVLQEQLDNKDN